MITLDDAILWLSESGFQKEIEDKTFLEGDSSIRGIPVGTNFFFVQDFTEDEPYKMDKLAVVLNEDEKLDHGFDDNPHELRKYSINFYFVDGVYSYASLVDESCDNNYDLRNWPTPRSKGDFLYLVNHKVRIEVKKVIKYLEDLRLKRLNQLGGTK
jgi:hypothetical protein|tara:strand:- start:604 stop:1071 length:468 start_codon:yes stop_codon:yes gene_type:complete